MGHFECDNIESCRGNQQRRKFSCLIIITYRLSCKTIITKAASKTSKQTTISILKDLKPYQNIVKSITYDNGLQFSNHEKINNILNIKSYFCKPYANYQKETLENINGIIKRFFSKRDKL